MSEYKRYKNYYIGHGTFGSKEEIDQFIRQQAIDAHRTAVQVFFHNPTMAHSAYLQEQSETLVNQYGFDWEQIDELEAQIMAELDAA